MYTIKLLKHHTLVIYYKQLASKQTVVVQKQSEAVTSPRMHFRQFHITRDDVIVDGRCPMIGRCNDSCNVLVIFLTIMHKGTMHTC